MSNYEQHDDSIREENESPQLVQDLHSLYETHSADVQSLARIRSRLLQRTSIPLPDKEDDNIITMQPLGITEKREEAMPSASQRINEWRNARRHWPRLVSEIAALVLITALIGSVVLVFTLRPHAPGHGGLKPLSSDQVQQIHMIDAKIGWAVTQPRSASKYNIGLNEAIMHTTDSGQTWYDVTPPEPLGAKPVPSNVTAIATAQASSSAGTSFNSAWGFQTDFFSSSTAWVAVMGPPFATPLFFTHDGGRTWSVSNIPAIYIKQMSFIDAQHGWVLADSSLASMTSHVESVDDVTLLQTIDGGKTWTKASGVSYDQIYNQTGSTARGPLPAFGIKTGFTFIDSQTGWMVGETDAANVFWLYVTHDGGHTWQHQSVPLPSLSQIPSGTPVKYFPQPPVFFDNGDGVLPFFIPTNVTSEEQGQMLELYTTHDSGKIWQSTPSPFATSGGIYYTYKAPQMLDATHGVFTLGNDVFFLHGSTTGGEWGITPVHSLTTRYKNNEKIVQADFISSNDGWILLDNSHPYIDEVDANDPLLLYHTTNGGQTWTQINYSVMGQHVQTSQKLNKGWTAVASYSGTGSKVMFLRGQIVPSKQWWLVYSCSGTGSLAVSLSEAHFSGDAPSCSATSLALHSGSAGIIQQKVFTPISIQVQADSSTEWSFLIVECSSSQGCSDSPIAK